MLSLLFSVVQFLQLEQVLWCTATVLKLLILVH